MRVALFSPALEALFGTMRYINWHLHYTPLWWWCNSIFYVPSKTDGYPG